jgi:hypothetical protein
MSSTSVPCEGCGAPCAVSPGVRPICPKCAQRTGLAAPAAIRRPAVPCARCGGRVLVHARVRERTVETGRETTWATARPLAITFGRGTDTKMKGFLEFQKHASPAPDVEQPFGVLEAWVCRACGSVEWYAQSPEQIPIGPLYGTTLLEVTAEGRYVEAKDED